MRTQIWGKEKGLGFSAKKSNKIRPLYLQLKKYNLSTRKGHAHILLTHSKNTTVKMHTLNVINLPCTQNFLRWQET